MFNFNNQNIEIKGKKNILEIVDNQTGKSTIVSVLSLLQDMENKYKVCFKNARKHKKCINLKTDKANIEIGLHRGEQVRFNFNGTNVIHYLPLRKFKSLFLDFDIIEELKKRSTENSPIYIVSNNTADIISNAIYNIINECTSPFMWRPFTSESEVITTYAKEMTIQFDLHKGLIRFYKYNSIQYFTKPINIFEDYLIDKINSNTIMEVK